MAAAGTATGVGVAGAELTLAASRVVDSSRYRTGSKSQEWPMVV